MEAVNICECYDSNGTRIPPSSSKYPLKDGIVHTNIKEIYDREMREIKDAVNICEFYDKDGTRIPPSSSKYHMFMHKYGIDAATN